MRESFVSFVLTNMPMLYPLLKSFLEKIGTTLALTRNGGSGRANGTGQAHRLESYPKNKKTRNKDPNPVPEDTRYGSNERMVSLDDESRDAAFNGDGVTVIDQPHGAFHVAGGCEPARVTACSSPSSSDARHPTPLDHSNAGGIIVTRDYNVSEGCHINYVDQHDRAFLDV